MVFSRWVVHGHRFQRDSSTLWSAIVAIPVMLVAVVLWPVTPIVVDVAVVEVTPSAIAKNYIFNKYNSKSSQKTINQPGAFSWNTKSLRVDFAFLAPIVFLIFRAILSGFT